MLCNREKVQPQRAGTHARLSLHVLGILNHGMAKHRSNRDSATPNSLLQVVKLWYIMPPLLHSPEGRIKRRQRFVGYIALPTGPRSWASG